MRGRLIHLRLTEHEHVCIFSMHVSHEPLCIRALERCDIPYSNARAPSRFGFNRERSFGQLRITGNPIRSHMVSATRCCWGSCRRAMLLYVFLQASAFRRICCGCRCCTLRHIPRPRPRPRPPLTTTRGVHNGSEARMHGDASQGFWPRVAVKTRGVHAERSMHMKWRCICTTRV